MKINKLLLKNNNITLGTNKCIYLVLHHTGVIGEGNIRILSGRDSKVSVHYLVMQDGRVYQFVDENKIARHCGQSSYHGMIDMNKYCIGIEIESDGKTYTEIQRKKTRELVTDIIKRNYMGVENIIRHKDITSRKRDVSDDFRDSEYQTFTDYQNSFLDTNKNKMTENQKQAILKSIANLCSVVYDNIDSIKSEIMTANLLLSIEELQNQVRKTKEVVSKYVK